MCQYQATDGHIGPWHHAHLGAFATGAPGLIMVEATGVIPEGRISIGCTSIEDDAHANNFKEIIDFAHSFNVKMGIQLAHAGRKASTMRPWDDHRMATPAEIVISYPMFKELVKLAITPMISSLSLMENAETENEVLSIGISVIMLNIGMYLGVPAMVVIGIRKKF